MGLRSEELPFLNECFHGFEDPKIIKNFISYEDCEHVINISKGKMRPSAVGDYSEVSEIRVSESSIPNNFDPIIEKIRFKCAKYTNTPFLLLEDTQVTHYNTGGYYRIHKDEENGVYDYKRRFTFIIALNDDYKGGYTEFPNINKRYKLNKGDALFFSPTSGIHKIASDLAEHSGTPVTEGEKWIINQWIFCKEKTNKKHRILKNFFW